MTVLTKNAGQRSQNIREAGASQATTLAGITLKLTHQVAFLFRQTCLFTQPELKDLVRSFGDRGKFHLHMHQHVADEPTMPRDREYRQAEDVKDSEAMDVDESDKAHLRRKLHRAQRKLKSAYGTERQTKEDYEQAKSRSSKEAASSSSKLARRRR